MALKRKIKKLEELSPKLLRSATIVLCSEESVRCRYLPLFKKMAKKTSRLFIAMPSEELKEGSRGWAKAQILTSIDGVDRVIACSRDELRRLLKGEFGRVEQIGEISVGEEKGFFPKKIPIEKIKVSQTTNSVDWKFMKQALRLVSKGECWWRSTACVFVRDKQIVAKGFSVNPYKTGCKEISIDSEKIIKDLEEQIHFCNAIHAEAVAIARAARKGIPLKGTILYVTVCPCEECAKILIETGVKKVVFSGEYYDRTGLVLLKKYGIKVLKIKNVGS